MSQEHFRGRIMKRMMGETEFKKFTQEYEKYKAYNVAKEVFREEVTPATRNALFRIKHFDF